MNRDNDIQEFLLHHLNAIQDNDIDTYHTTTSEELTLYEWWITPHRLEGIPFHDFMMNENARWGTVFGAESEEGELSGQEAHIRLDLANLHIQRYDDTAIASYTLLVSTSKSGKIQVAAHNETRVIVKLEGKWKVVHVHKSPAWSAPHIQP